MTARRTAVSNPADLLLRISRTPAGLHITSPQLPGWTAVARGPVPIAQAVDAGFTELACATYAAKRGETYDLTAWDAAAEALAAAGATLTPADVVIVRDGVRAARPSGMPSVQRGLTRLASADRPATGKDLPQHDPFAWVDLGNGQWRSPAGNIYGEQTRHVQGMLRRRAEAAASSACGQQTFDDVAS